MARTSRRSPPPLQRVDATVLTHAGAYEARGSPTPWRDYANALIDAKDIADANAAECSHWPAVSLRCYKLYSTQLTGISTDLGGPDLTAFGPADAWPCSAQDPLPETGVTFQTSDAALQGLYVHGDTQ